MISNISRKKTLNQQNGEQVSFDEACRFIIKLGLAAHNYGSTSAELEAYLSRLTATLGYPGTFTSTPNEVMFAFQEREDQWQKLHLVTMPGTGSDLDKLARVGDIVASVEAQEISISDASVRLDEIAKTPPPWGKIANLLSYAFCGCGLAILFGGGWIDALVATLFSVIVYGMVLFAGRQDARMADWLPLYSAFVVAVLATIMKIGIPELNIVTVILASIVVLLPGYTVSLGVIELVSQNVVSGTTNLINGLVYLVKQFLGGWLGVGLVSALLTIPTPAAGTPVNSAWLWLFMPLVIAALGFIFQTNPRDFLWVCMGCAVAYSGTLLGSALVSANLGTLLGTIFTVIFANLWAKSTNRPVTIVLLPAIVLLVSGSIGFRGLAAIAAGQTITGLQEFIQMFVVSLLIAGGLLVGNTIVRPKVTL
jgi:uncharacterized membrane protein YjjP (DUF1212 family)